MIEVVIGLLSMALIISCVVKTINDVKNIDDIAVLTGKSLEA